MTNDETKSRFLRIFLSSFRNSNFGFRIYRAGSPDPTNRGDGRRAAPKPEAQKETFRRGREGFFVVPRPKLEPRPKFGIV
jgi:hypothetical protein